MTEPDEAAIPQPPTDWLVWMGLVLTAVWLTLGLLYVFGVVGMARWIGEGPPAVGSFLEGVVSPVAFLWLVIGYFIQRKELARSNRAIYLQYLAMQRTAEHAETQARAIAANEMHARQEGFLQILDLLQQQLETALGMLFMSSQSEGAGGEVPWEELQRMWTQLGTGDETVFARGLMGAHFQGDRGRDTWTLFWSTPIRATHSERFIATFERTLERAASCDASGMLVETLLGSTHGQIYELMRTRRNGMPPADPVQDGA